MLLFDIGANCGDATEVGLSQGYKVIALEPAPKIYQELVKRYIYNPMVIPLKYAVSDTDMESVKFYETTTTDALSSLNKEWLTKEGMPYNGFEYRTITATTITVDTLAKIYGEPDLMKIDVEGAEWGVFKGMSCHHGELTFEWTYQTLKEHQLQMDYLYSIGYREYSPQYITTHLLRPTKWFPLQKKNEGALYNWVTLTKDEWELDGWKDYMLRYSADVGMLWLK